MSKTIEPRGIIDRMIGDDVRLRRMVEEETANAYIAQAIYDIRTNAGLTQTALAKLVHTTQPVIARLEDADYRGHSLNMLVRIASALNKKLDIRFLDAGGKPRRRARKSATLREEAERRGFSRDEMESAIKAGRAGRKPDGD